MSSLQHRLLRRFLSSGTRTGKLGFVAADGRPLIAPVWFVLAADAVWFNTAADSAKARAIRRDPRMVLCVDLEKPPYDFVQLQGTVTSTTEPDMLREIATAVGARYMGDELAEEFGQRNSVPGSVAVALTPSKIVSSLDVDPASL